MSGSVVGRIVGGSLFVLVACGPPPQPVSATINVPSLKVHDNPEVTKDGLTIALTPIGPENIRKFPQVAKKIAWKETVQTQPGLVSGGGPQEVERSEDTELVPLPCFQVRVANHTGHVMKFTQSVFRLQDNAGRTYNLFAGTAEIAAWHEAAHAKDPGAILLYQMHMKAQVASAINGLQLLTRNVELLNGDEWTGYLVFNVNVNSPKDYDAFMGGIERLTLRLAEMPTKTDEGGKVVGTTEFTFALDKVTAPLPVTCPPGTQEPTREKCRQQARLRGRPLG